MKILCIGQSAYDITLVMDRYPEENKKVRLNKQVECGGGSASNCSYLLAKWGLDVFIAGVIGNDYYGKKILDEYDKIGINRKYLQITDKHNTTVSYIVANTTTGTRTIITNRDKEIAMKDFLIEDNFDIILFDGYEKEFSLEVIRKNPNAIKIIDAGSLRESTVELSKLMDYVVCSHDFLEAYSKKEINYSDIESIKEAYKILEKDFKGQIVVTLEERGSFAKIDSGYKLIPSIRTIPIDTTGAGDIYHGSFIYCISQGFSLEKTMLFSNISGALSVLKIGSRFSIPELKEVEEKYNAVISR